VQSTYIVIYSFSSTYIAIYLFIYIHYNLFNQNKVFGELTLVCRWRRLPCTSGRATTVAEEEAGSSGVNGGGGDRHERRRQRWRRLAE
jgi:hypothetical protein